ncbi:MAG: hypothetical protein GYB33_17530 [Gammaproteobacteria bacterium]|uniref:3'-5' exonuclease n=1 Tax=Pseudomaricurvus alcaniphilus TaxID=1166482 RepID=UPI001407B70E|nr:hypothetical protein [Pseudomaricurvus alcaniphilus]MBR9912146.1 hypothetical protein [Gammaproteobacteria bacterium]NHN35714.1 hypothetical protein [Pseudomaricurvus alcaniphilus]
MKKINSRPNIIDIEASGFGHDSYPIEVGVVLSSGKRYSRLIKPFSDWRHWCEKAEAVHGIERQALLEYGTDPQVVARGLNNLLAGTTVYSDCWGVDKPWLETLFYRCGLPMNFFISPIESILAEPQMQYWQTTMEEARKALKLGRHRASMDALVIQETFANTLQLVQR